MPGTPAPTTTTPGQLPMAECPVMRAAPRSPASSATANSTRGKAPASTAPRASRISLTTSTTPASFRSAIGTSTTGPGLTSSLARCQVERCPRRGRRVGLDVLRSAPRLFDMSTTTEHQRRSVATPRLWPRLGRGPRAARASLHRARHAAASGISLVIAGVWAGLVTGDNGRLPLLGSGAVTRVVALAVSAATTGAASPPTRPT